MLKIVADVNTPLISSAFRGVGELSLLETGSFCPAAIAQADALVVRSETKVDESLLRGSPVRFVGTVTIGTDHVDTGYLRSKGIGFASAPGSNANSVKEYVLAALLAVGERLGLPLQGVTIGVVGVGNIGSRVAALAEALGMRVLLNDPPLARATGDPKYLALDALMEADILTLHVPLTDSGPDPTYHLFGPERISLMKNGAVLVNTSRGAVVDGSALLAALEQHRLAACVLDVWEHEPRIDRALLRRVSLATPHIAGYSLDGKINAVKAIREALCNYFGMAVPWDPWSEIAAPPDSTLVPPPGATSWEETLRSLVPKCYDILEDDRNLRAAAQANGESSGREFSRLRKQYRVRREFHNYRVPSAGIGEQAARILSAVEFRLE